MRLGRIKTNLYSSSSTAVSGGAAPNVPTLTGPLEVTDPTGEAVFTVDRACQIYWMVSAGGTTPTAAEIAAGTGAIEGTGAVKAMGNFAAALGSVQMDVTFPVGINAAGTVFSVVARVEPDGAWSNVLRDTSVDVETLPLSATFVSAQTGASPNFGTVAAGSYIAVVMARVNTAGTINSITPPSQSAVTTPLAQIQSNVKPIAVYLVTLTASRSGAWTIGHTSGISYATALYSLSAAPQLISQDSSFANNTSANYSFSRSVTAGDILIAAANLHTNPAEAESGADDVATDSTGVPGASHSYRALSGTVPASGTRTIFAQTSGNFTNTAALVAALRRA